MKSKIKQIAIASLIFLAAAQPAFADISFCGGRGENPCTMQDLAVLLFRVVNYLIAMSGLVAVLFIVWGGLQMLLSAGNPQAVGEAKKTVWYAVIGFILVLLSYIIVGYVVGLLLPGAASGDPIENILKYIIS